ncbi:MAG: hypothetical protein GVY13_16780 [Alphaproteobacteria bacterium]|nr:hypothetical protein [Alphaproteobacteria bacterium]
MDEAPIDMPALVDETVIDRMAADLDQETVDACLKTFLTEMLGRVERIVNAVQAHDWVKVGAEAHALKASSGTFGARRMADTARAIEEACQARRDAAAAELTKELATLARQTSASLAAHSSGQGRGGRSGDR